MSVHMARSWWAIGLRGVATIAFGLALVLTLPSATTASLVMLFAAYLAADGFFAIVTAEHAAKHARRWWMQILEGLTNLGVAGWVPPCPEHMGHRHRSPADCCRAQARPNAWPLGPRHCRRRLDRMGHSAGNVRA
jgi:hypothetical protein